MRRLNFALVVALLFLVNHSVYPQNNDHSKNLALLAGEVILNGQQARYLNRLSDEIGHRLTGTPNGEKAEKEVLTWLKELGLENVHLEPFQMPAQWSRGTALVRLISPTNRALTAASYTWTPGTKKGGVEGPIVDAGTGSVKEINAVGNNLKGAIVLASPSGVTLDEIIGNFYRTPEMVREVAEAGAQAVLIASDKERTLLYTAPVSFNGEVSPLPALSLAREDVDLLRRLLNSGKDVRVKLTVENTLGPAFEAHNVVGEIRGSEKPEEVIILGAHLDSNDLGPGALDDAAGSAALLETARAIKSLGLKPRRTIRFIFFMGEEEGMLGSTAYVKQHLQEMDQVVAVLIMDIGAGKPLGWFSMGRTDLDDQIQELMKPLNNLGVTQIVHAAFAATDNAAFMAAGVPNLVMLQDDAPYFPVHHTAADTPDKADLRDFASSVVTLAVTTFKLADQPERFGKRLNTAEVETLIQETGIDSQWRAAGILPLK
jgi:Iap family predicted aminopeptidase